MVMLGALALLATPAQAQKSADGYYNWSRVGAFAVKKFKGGDPVYQNQARSQVLTAMGYNAYETNGILQQFNSDKCIAGTIKAGDEFEKGSFLDRNGRPKVTGKVRLTDTSESSFAVCRIYINAGDVVNGYKFTRDITLTLVYKCANVVVERRPPPPPAPPVKTPPPPVIPPAPPVKIPPPPPAEARKFCDNLRVNAVVGAEVEIDEAMARSGYGAWGVYCMKKLKDGRIGFGPAGQMAVYGSNPGDGKFNGHLIAGGVGMMREWNSGQDLEVKLMAGDYSSNYRESDYRSREHRTVLAVSAAHNNYSGRIDGSNRPERQIFGMIGLPIGGSSSHSWQGKDLGNASALNLYANVGVRQYLLKEDPKRQWNPYVQVGALGEIRSGDDYFSCSLRIGVTNKRRTMGVHAGINACDGGIVPAIGAWYDVGTDLRLRRAEKRAAALSDDNGEGRKATTTVTGRRLNATRE